MQNANKNYGKITENLSFFKRFEFKIAVFSAHS